MVNSVINEGARGLQNSQRELLRNANEIARVASPGSESSGTQALANQNSSLAPVTDTAQSERSRDISEPLIELRRQELLFNASAKVVSTGDETLGSLLDTLA